MRQAVDSNFDLSGMRGDALGELFQGKKFPKPLKTSHNILYSLRRFIDTNREALALSLGYRVASESVINTKKRFIVELSTRQQWDNADTTRCGLTIRLKLYKIFIGVLGVWGALGRLLASSRRILRIAQVRAFALEKPPTRIPKKPQFI